MNDLAAIISRLKTAVVWETCYRMEQALHITMAKTPWEYWLTSYRLAIKYQAEEMQNEENV